MRALAICIVALFLSGCLGEPAPEPAPVVDEPPVVDPTTDQDGDGFTGAWEEANGFDPLNISSAPECNLHRALCARALNATVFATTHNSHASWDRGHHAFSGNHRTNITAQLDGGIRALNFDVHEYRNQTVLCHGGYEDGLPHPCFLSGYWKLSEAFTELEIWMSNHSTDVVVLTLESYVNASVVAGVANETNLTAHLFAMNGTVWPSLAQIIEAGPRLILFADDAPDVPISWWHEEGEYMAKTHWAYNDTAWFNCELTRGNLSSPLRWLDHYVTDPVANEWAANASNQRMVVIERGRQCEAAWEQTPNFVAVDYWEQGDVVDAVRALNGLSS